LGDSRGEQFLNGNAQNIAENGNIFVRDAPDARFVPGENVPTQVPSHPLTPDGKVGLRDVEMISRLTHLLANQIAFSGHAFERLTLGPDRINIHHFPS